MPIVSQGLLPTLDSSWLVAGTGDFNRDGKDDVAVAAGERAV